MTQTARAEELERRVIDALSRLHAHHHPLLPSEVGRHAGLNYHQALAGLEAADALGLVDSVEDDDGTVRYRLPAHD